MLPCVKYRDAYLVPFPEYADSNLPLPVQVIHGIVQVVGDDLLYLKLIRPHPYRLLLFKYNPGLLLLQQNAG